MTDKQYDLPFIYASYLNAATVGSIDNVSVQLALPMPFHLRRAVFAKTLQVANLNVAYGSGVTSFQLYDRNGRSLTGLWGSRSVTAASPSVFTPEVIVAPESVYQAGDAIRYDYSEYPVIANRVRPILFQGVHRSRTPINPKPKREGNFVERPYQYVVNVSMTVPVNTPDLSLSQNYQAEIRDYDFELRRILIVDGLTIAAFGNLNGYAVGGLFSYILQNAYSQALMSAPVPDWFLANNNNFLTSIFPVPAIIYPIGSLIKLQAFNSFYDGTQRAAAQQVIFDGVQRFPCA